MEMYIATYAIDVAALIYLIGVLKSSAALNIYRKKPFMIGIILTLIVIASESVTVFVANGGPSLRSINVLCNIIGFTLAPIIPLVIAYVFDGRILRKHKLLFIPSLVNAVAAISSPLSKLIFYVDANNHYFRENYYFIFIAVYYINLLLLIISTLEVGKKYNYPIKNKLVALAFFTIIGTSIQLQFPTSYSTWHCATLALLLYFLLLSEFDSSFDTLSGFYNRAAFDKTIKDMPASKAFSFIIIDINDFKSFNDTYGHDYGDNLIRKVAEIIRKSFNRHYTCYRFGGDEFSIISNETDQKKIENQLKIMIDNIADMRESGTPLPTVSYGYRIFNGEDELDFHEILQQADKQMYHFKMIHKADAEK
jgi:diguanylate cyclase (GGDEF)-like protein